MVDRFCQPFSSNTSGNKGVLHRLGANCFWAQVDNFCAKRPRRKPTNVVARLDSSQFAQVGSGLPEGNLRTTFVRNALIAC